MAPVAPLTSTAPWWILALRINEQQYDVVLDAVGKSTFGRCRRLLKASPGRQPERDPVKAAW